MATNEIELVCFLIGDVSQFSVTIGLSKSIASLKEEIKKNKYDVLGEIMASKLNIWKVLVPSSEQENLRNIANEKIRGKEDLFERDRIDEHFRPELGYDVCVIVKRPDVTGTWESEAVPLDTSIIRRHSLVDYLLEKVQKSKLIQVRGVPASGKTVLMHLLHLRIEEKMPDVLAYRITSWRTLEGNSYEEKLRHIIGHALEDSSKLTFLLFDDAHDTYDDHKLWSHFFKNISIFQDYCVILFCRYGSTAGRVADPDICTPDKFSDSQKMMMRPTSSFPYGLTLERDEIEEVSKIQYRKLSLSTEVIDIIFAWTGGHVGVVRYFLASIIEKNETRQRKRALYTLDRFLHQHPPELTARIFAMDPGGRGLPNFKVLYKYPDMVSMYRQMLRDSRIIVCEGKNSTVHRAYKFGFVHAESVQGQTVFTIATPVHAAYLSWLLEPEPVNLPYETLYSLVEAVVTSFRPSEILETIWRAGEDSNQYQTEFYKKLYDITKGNVSVSPEYCAAESAPKLGRVDFYIKKYGWGIEFIRKESKVKEHVSQFGIWGAYGSWYNTGEMQDHILLDCRTAFPTQFDDNKNLYYVVFLRGENENDLPSVTILDGKGKSRGKHVLVEND